MQGLSCNCQRRIGSLVDPPKMQQAGRLGIGAHTVAAFRTGPMGDLFDRATLRPMIVAKAGAAAAAAVSTAIFGHRWHMHLYVGLTHSCGLAVRMQLAPSGDQSVSNSA